MIIEALGITGAHLVTPDVHRDDRGDVHEWYRPDLLGEVTGADWRVRQGNMSRSRRGALRGIHFAQVPPGQAKYVTCVSGAVADIVVDVRLGSPTYARWVPVELDAKRRSAVLIGEGLGHGFQALTEDAVVVYLMSHKYSPTLEHAVNPLCPTLAIEWPLHDRILSPKDASAPTLPEAAARGLLPRYAA